METSDDQCSSFESRVSLTKEDEECIRSLGYIIYFDIIVKGTGGSEMPDQVEKLVTTYDRTINRFNKADSLLYFFFHFARNFGDFMIYDSVNHVCTDRIFDINDMEDENFKFNISHVKLRVTNKFNSDDSKLFFVHATEWEFDDLEFVRVHVFYLSEEINTFMDQKNVSICIVKDPLKINQSKRIAFLKELFSQFYAKFFRNFFDRVLFGLPFHSPDWSYASS